MPWPLNGNCLTESTMIYIFCSTTKQARQNVLFIGGHRILSPDVIIRLLIKMFKSNASKNLQKIVKNSPKIALNIHPNYSPEKFTPKIGQIPQVSLSAQTPWGPQGPRGNSKPLWPRYLAKKPMMVFGH